MAELRRALFSDALTIVRTRQKAWAAIYRGIYPDTVLDDFDYDWHLAAEQRRLSDPHYRCDLVMDGDSCVGYAAYGPVQNGFRLYSIYLLPGYQGCGLGRMLFERIAAACAAGSFRQMRCCCHPANIKAMDFYRHMGGLVTHMDIGHENPQEDSCTIEFKIHHPL